MHTEFKYINKKINAPSGDFGDEWRAPEAGESLALSEVGCGRGVPFPAN